MFDMMTPLSWYEREQKKKEEHLKTGNITQINHQLQNLMNRVKHKIDDWEKYQAVANCLAKEHRVIQSSLWHLSWANNFESEDVALAQGIFIYHILKNEHNLKQSKHFQKELDSLMKRLNYESWGMYEKFHHLKDKF